MTYSTIDLRLLLTAWPLFIEAGRESCIHFTMNYSTVQKWQTDLNKAIRIDSLQSYSIAPYFGIRKLDSTGLPWYLSGV